MQDIGKQLISIPLDQAQANYSPGGQMRPVKLYNPADLEEIIFNSK